MLELEKDEYISPRCAEALRKLSTEELSNVDGALEAFTEFKNGKLAKFFNFIKYVNNLQDNLEAFFIIGAVIQHDLMETKNA